MAREGNRQESDERIGVAVIEKTFRGALTEVRAEELPSLGAEPARLESQRERSMVDDLANITLIIGEKVKDNTEFQDAIDGFSRGPGSVLEKFSMVVNKVFDDGQITWERITLLFYVAGRLAIKVVETHHTPQLVVDLLRWTVDYFRTTLLSWIQSHGGWVSGIAVLSRAALRGIPSVNSQKFALLFFLAWMALGGFISWRLARSP